MSLGSGDNGTGRSDLYLGCVTSSQTPWLQALHIAETVPTSLP
jgi:hypothetical protein